jgi:uncharacterized protein YciI
MGHFLLRLVPPRASFPQDMSEAEREVMRVHADYWRDLTGKGTCLVYGPVLDASSPWGLAIVETESEQDTRQLFEADPAVSSGTCTFAMAPMIVAATRAERR